MYKKAISISLFIISLLGAYEKRVIFLIHGTWAQKERWYMPGGVFYDALQRSIEKMDTIIVPFLWPGGLSHEDRLHGARALAELIKSYKSDVEIIIIAHSHGANVALLASQLLGQDRQLYGRISALFTLGVPVYKESYQPDMRVICALYNLFSFEDGVQTVFGLADRKFDAHSCIANLCITIDGYQPCHNLLHSETVARWILTIPTLLKAQKKSNQGLIHFFTGKTPCYEKKDFWRMHLNALIHKTVIQKLDIQEKPFFHVFSEQLYQEFHLPNDMHQLQQMTLQAQLLH